jgi:hypothetical protein
MCILHPTCAAARAGKRKTASVGKGNTWLRSTLIQAAHAAVRVKDS